METFMCPKFVNLLTGFRKSHTTHCSLLHMVELWGNTFDP